MNSVALNHTIEPRNCYSSSQARSDIAVYNATDFNAELDISLAHPWCADVISAAALNQGAAASKREERKIERYRKEKHVSGILPKLVPLVFEQFWPLGKGG